MESKKILDLRAFGSPFKTELYDRKNKTIILPVTLPFDLDELQEAIDDARNGVPGGSFYSINLVAVEEGSTDLTLVAQGASLLPLPPLVPPNDVKP